MIWEKCVAGSGSDSSLSLYRAKVPGGWFVRVGADESLNLIFYPDPRHEWNGKTLP